MKFKPALIVITTSANIIRKHITTKTLMLMVPPQPISTVVWKMEAGNWIPAARKRS
jgi:hypothetical protein